MRVDWAGAIEDKELSKIKIGGEEFTGIGYQGLLSVNTKTYIDEPTRSNDGSMPDIDDHDTFIVPRCKVNFKFLNIQDYQRLCRVLNSANQFPVEFFDKQFGKRKTYMMYAEPEEMSKIFNVGTSVIGLIDYEISFVSTRNDLKKYKVEYSSQFFDGGVHYLSRQSIDYNKDIEYFKGQIVYWNNNYYEAIYYEDSFSNKNTGLSSFWEVKSDTEWNDEKLYVTGDLVYTKKEISINGTTSIEYKYYEAIGERFSGFMPTNTEYWKEVKISPYKSDKTYKYGDYVGEYNSIKGKDIIFKAIYYKDYFINKQPDDTAYWTKITAKFNTPKEIEWGNSTKTLSGDDLQKFYEIPEGKILKGWNTRIDGKGFNVLQNSNWTVFEDVTFYPIFVNEV